MTAATPDSGPNLFSALSLQNSEIYKTRREAFVFSLAGQAAVLGIIIYLTTCVISTPRDLAHVTSFSDIPLIFSGHNGGGGGGFDALPASRGNLPRASLDTQIVPPTVVVPKEMPMLAVEETVVVAPEIKYPQGGQIGDPSSLFSRWLSNGPGGPGGIGKGCCDGVGDSVGPHVGSGPPGIYPAGKRGVSVPQVIYDPEPNF